MADELSIQQVAEREGVTRQTVHNWLKDGLDSHLVTVHGLKQERRIEVYNLNAWLAEKRTDRSGS